MSEKNDRFDEVLAFLEKRRKRTVEDDFNDYLDGKPKGEANAVTMSVQGMPCPILISDFEFESGTLIPPKYLTALEKQTGFPVCCISGWRPEDGSFNKAMEFFTFLYQCHGTCLVCGFEGGNPAPLTNEQAQKVSDELAYVKILKNRGKL